MDNIQPTREQLERDVDDLRRQVAELTAEQNRARRTMQEHDRAQTYLDLAGVMFVALDVEGTVVLVNRKACEVLEYTEEQIVGRNWFDTCLPPHLHEAVKDVSKQLMCGEIELVEYYENAIITRSGAERIVAWHNAALRDDEGMITGVLSSGQDITDRKRAEEELRSEKQFTEAALDSQQDTFFLFEAATGKAIRWNRAFRDVSGYSDEEIAAQVAPGSYYSPEDIERAGRLIQEVLETGVGTVELELICKDGHTVPTEYNVSVVRDEEGKAKHVISIGRDATDRKRAEESLRESEATSRGVLEALPDLMFRLSRDGTHLDFHAPNRDDLYVAPEGIVGKTVGELLPEDVAGMFMEHIPRTLENQATEIFEYVLEFDGGDRRSFEARMVPFAPDSVLTTVRNTTERKRAEEALRRYECIVSSASDMLALLDRNFVYLAVNDAYTAVTGKTMGQLVGHTVSEVFGEEVFDTVIRPHAERCLAGDEVHFEDWFDFPVHGRRYMSIAYFPYLAEDETVLGFAVSGRDITHRKFAEEERDRLEEQLRQSQKMETVGQLAGGIAHDFNNILTAIQGNAELLKLDLPPVGEHMEFVDEVIKGAKRAADLTSQLLAFARKGKWQVVSVDIHDVVTQTVSMLTHAIDRRIEIRLDLHASPSTVMGDPTQLQNALLNLGVNARDAMADGGVLTYATRNVTLTQANCDEHPYQLTPGEFLEIRVVDTGVGMDEQTQARMFEPFFTTKEVGKGTGLGLAGVYGCVKSHNGSISVSSQRGQGTTLTIRLPRADEGSAAETRPAANDASAGGTGHVLIVDDEKSVCGLVSTALRKQGYAVSTCTDGAWGVDYYRQHHREIDLVILDLIMPKMNGQDAFGEMKKINPNVKVIVSSGFSQSQAVNQMLDDGVLAVLSKPFEITKLLNVVAESIQ